MSRIGEHQNVVSLLGACEHDGSMFLCTEYAPNGNLLKFLRNSRRSGEGTITQSQLLTFATDVAEGMTYLSDKQVAKGRGKGGLKLNFFWYVRFLNHEKSMCDNNGNF